MVSLPIFLDSTCSSWTRHDHPAFFEWEKIFDKTLLLGERQGQFCSASHGSAQIWSVVSVKFMQKVNVELYQFPNSKGFTWWDMIYFKALFTRINPCDDLQSLTDCGRLFLKLIKSLEENIFYQFELLFLKDKFVNLTGNFKTPNRHSECRVNNRNILTSTLTTMRVKKRQKTKKQSKKGVSFIVNNACS